MKKAVWLVLLGVMAGLLGAGVFLLIARTPDGSAIQLLPPPTAPPLVIYLTGAVAEPGVYSLPPGSRVADALDMSEGRSRIPYQAGKIDIHAVSAAAIDKVAETFYLSEGEKHLLLSADIGEGLFFAGPAHAAVRIIASPEEHAVATTKPQDVAKRTVPETAGTKTPPEPTSASDLSPAVSAVPPQPAIPKQPADVPLKGAVSSRPIFRR